MNLSQVIRTVFEIVLVVFAVWAVFHEDIFIDFEERLISGFKRRRLNVIKGASARTVR